MNNLERVHINQIRVGDTVEHNGTLSTVCSHDLKHDRFIGVTLYGDSYQLGAKAVRRAVNYDR